MGNKVLFIVYVLYSFEVGLFLVFLPWTQLWDSNALLTYIPSLRDYVVSNYMRGAVSGLGISNILLGISELLNVVRRRRRPRVGASDSLRDY